MASILRVNTLTDASSNNSTAMSTINQGTAKAWANFSGGYSLTDSFNVGSLTDNGTGRPEFNFTSNMANSTYSAGGHSYNRVVGGYSGDGNFTTTSAAMTTIEPYVAFRDCASGEIAGVNYFGDLA